jgi:hypothetical protein
MRAEALVRSLFISLITTILLEAVFFRIVGKRNLRDFRLLVLVNILTNPVVVLSAHIGYYLIERYADSGFYYVILVFILEAAAVMVEGFCYRRYAETIGHPYIFSLGANAFSFGIGLIAQILL